jgi:hypothetical protein
MELHFSRMLNSSHQILQCFFTSNSSGCGALAYGTRDLMVRALNMEMVYVPTRTMDLLVTYTPRSKKDTLLANNYLTTFSFESPHRRASPTPARVLQAPLATSRPQTSPALRCMFALVAGCSLLMHSRGPLNALVLLLPRRIHMDLLEMRRTMLASAWMERAVIMDSTKSTIRWEWTLHGQIQHLHTVSYSVY